MKLDTKHVTPRVLSAVVSYIQMVVCHRLDIPPPSSRLHIVVDVSLLHLNWCVTILFGWQ